MRGFGAGMAGPPSCSQRGRDTWTRWRCWSQAGPTPTLSACKCVQLSLITSYMPCREGITATDVAFVAKNAPMLLALPPGSKGKNDSMQAAATVRAGGNAFPIQFTYVSAPPILTPGRALLTRFAAVGADARHRRRRRSRRRKSCQR
jgi:hypothetical protein